MTNFDFLLKEEQFNTFSSVAVNAEKFINIDIESSAINCRKAMEFAIKWMYSVDSSLVMPHDNNLISLMSNEDFREIVDNELLTRMHLVRKIGNNAVHTTKKVKKEEVMLCLENLFLFLDFVAYCYGTGYVENSYDTSLLEKEIVVPIKEACHDIDFESLIEENKKLKEELTQRREEQSKSYIPKPLDLSEYQTRKIYIDSTLRDANWVEGKNWLNEVRVEGMPNKKEEGFCDYVLYDDKQIPLAVIEAKRTCVDVVKGRQQAKLYADCIEKEYGRRPVIFLTNGFDTKIIDGQYPERNCANIYSKRDLEKLFNLRRMKSPLYYIDVNRNIAGRYYQVGAIKAVCHHFDEKNKRKSLLVMATGSGKTRTVIALSDVLLNYGWVKNILFLADRNSLVTQAKRSFVNLLPNLSISNLCEDKGGYNANCIFSTYQTMINVIDNTFDEEGKLFTSGHFDLIICDEAHRSIYNKYKDIFTYFDAPLVGLTATPKDEIDKNTYEIFELENGNPTYGYELAQAVKDGYLVDFLSVETTLKFLEQGINYDDLTEEEKEEYENTFEDEQGNIPEKINSSALNKWIFNEDTIKKVLHVLMSEGIHIEYGKKIGKSIIFAKNHDHAEKIYEVFNKEYPYLNGYAKVIDNYMTYAQSAIDEFSEPNKLPQIAISVDMLDTGIDIPEVLNLVFFKKVMSKAKFWQMIGRGTRLCPTLLDGEDKEKFYIFDFCGNFEFFRMNKGRATANMLALQGAILDLKTQIAFKLQDIAYQTEELSAFRKSLVDEILNKVKELDVTNFIVKQHLRYVKKYSLENMYNALTYEDTLLIKEHIAPLIIPDIDEASALRFDALVYGLELAYLVGKTHGKARSDLYKKVKSVASVANIPEIKAQSELIDKILNTDYIEDAGINEFEHIRENLRYLMKYIPKTSIKYQTNFTDDILTMVVRESEIEYGEMQNYRAKAEYYIRNNETNDAIAKLKTNQSLTKKDVNELETILWNEVGSKDDYIAEYGEKPLGEFVREIVGLDMNSAKEAFGDFLDNTNLDARQIYFVNQIIEYIVHNGMLKDLSVLQESPFTDRGSIVEVFTDQQIWMGIRNVINSINANVAA
ncbi:DEAD/DEAH box helicase family protein [Tannockella kyphosi]|uniref:DEAD/DEAH box helicase family protein n=1 Tax=Tannockella kyphosi TaxID=2899121 RepID=UPI002013268E|nr:DEAD/DEAH box helicase family protein [Tannockella kyphosi]